MIIDLSKSNLRFEAATSIVTLPKGILTFASIGIGSSAIRDAFHCGPDVAHLERERKGASVKAADF